MRTSDFYYDLPEELIAQTPLARRDASRLMTLDRATGQVGHHVFQELPHLLRPGDLVVYNDSRVLKARLFGVGETGSAVETLLLRDLGDNLWECLVRPGKRARPGHRIVYGNGVMTGEIEGETETGNRLIRFCYDGIFLERLDELGEMPLPPYIKGRLSDPERYQTIFACTPGSAAAPTAGLHFTPEVRSALLESGVGVKPVTLHVGLGTFRPVKADDITDHIMHAEWAELPAETAEAMAETKKAGGRVVAVGTTVCRTLESAAQKGMDSGSFWTDIFITPGYTFQAIDGLITNFHLPCSTLIMLVSALGGREPVLAAYAEAIRERYRFFSFGDAMLIV